jgi:hypothetical protein
LLRQLLLYLNQTINWLIIKTVFLKNWSRKLEFIAFEWISNGS